MESLNRAQLNGIIEPPTNRKRKLKFSAQEINIAATQVSTNIYNRAIIIHPMKKYYYTIYLGGCNSYM